MRPSNRQPTGRRRPKTQARRSRVGKPDAARTSVQLAASERRSSVAAGPVPLAEAVGQRQIVLALSGGLALGAYQAGAYATLHQSGLLPHRIAGCSIGAINGAIIAGNPPDQRIDRLARFWDAAAQSPPWPLSLLGLEETSIRHASALWTRLIGHPRLFRARFPLTQPALPARGAVGLYELGPFAADLEPLIDFDRVNAGGVHLSVSTVDMITGDEVLFESRRQHIGAAHLMASAAFPPDFLPIEIDGRLLGDGAMASNVPLRPALEEQHSGDVLCFVIDLFDRNGEQASSFDAALLRQYELIFANQCQREIDAQRQICELRRLISCVSALLPPKIRYSRKVAPILKQGCDRAIALLQLTYRPSAREGPAKAFDFSRVSLAERWRAGALDMARALEIVAEIASRPRRPGLTVHKVCPVT
jgi:NTE family protein